MRSLFKKNQRGAIRISSLVAIGIILLLLVVGSARYYSQRHEQARNNENVTVVENSAEDKNTKAKEQEESEKNLDTADSSSATTAISASDLPSTGPESSIVEAIGVFLLSMSIFRYFSSRKYALNYL